MTEEELIASLKGGDEAAYKKIYDIYHRPLCLFAGQLINDTQQVQDIVAEIFIKLFERRLSFENVPKIKAYLYISVKNACLNHIKSYNRRERHHNEIIYFLEESDDYAESKIVKAELIHEILKTVDNLPPIRRKIFLMIYMEGLSTGEIAKELAISPDTVRVQKARALATLRAIFVNDKLLFAAFMLLINKSPE